MAEAISPCEGVKRAYVRLERFRDGEPFIDYAPNLRACRGALQMAVSLYSDGDISLEGVERIGRELIETRYERADLTEQFANACSRGLVADAVRSELVARLVGAGLIDEGEPPPVDPAWTSHSDAFWTPPEARV